MDDRTFKAYYQHTEHFEISNPNPAWKVKRGLRWDRPDCVVRAVANATGWEWLDAFDWLVNKARRDFTSISDGTRLHGWLEEHGGKWTACKAERGKRRMTALDFAKSHPEGRYLLKLANHDTAVVNGKILDTYNCGDACVYGFVDMADFID